MVGNTSVEYRNMNFNIEVRKKQLESLNQYINSSKDKVETVLGFLGWNAKKVSQMSEKTTCPLNKGHVVPLENVVKHVETCRVVSAGYSLQEPHLPEAIGDPESCITLDQTKKIEILNEARSGNPKFRAAWNGHDPDPMTADRIITTYSADERLTFYEYCIKNTKGPPVPPEFDIIHENSKKEKELTHEEKLEQERNAKRRRAKYKSVHTGRNKTYTEVMREVIGNQMELFEEYLIKQEEKENEEKAKALYEDTENDTVLDNPHGQTYSCPDNNFAPNEYSLQETNNQVGYYDDQYEKYIPTDYFTNIQNCQTLSSKNYSYNANNYTQTPSGQTDLSNYYNGAIYEDLNRQTSVSTNHNTHSEKPVGTDYNHKMLEDIDFSGTYISEKHYSKKYSSERKETHRGDEYRKHSPDVSDRDHRKYQDHSRKYDRSDERYKDESKYSSRDRHRDARGEDRRYTHDSRRSRDHYRYERRRN